MIPWTPELTGKSSYSSSSTSFSSGGCNSGSKNNIIENDSDCCCDVASIRAFKNNCFTFFCNKACELTCRADNKDENCCFRGQKQLDEKTPFAQQQLGQPQAVEVASNPNGLINAAGDAKQPPQSPAVCRR